MESSKGINTYFVSALKDFFYYAHNYSTHMRIAKTQNIKGIALGEDRQLLNCSLQVSSINYELYWYHVKLDSSAVLGEKFSFAFVYLNILVAEVREKDL